MNVDALIFWLFVIAWVAVGVLLVFVQVPRIVREVRGVVRRVTKLSRPSALLLQISKAESDLGRIDNAVAQLPALRDRVQAALAVARAAAVVPPEIRPFFRRVQREVAAFRAAFR